MARHDDTTTTIPATGKHIAPAICPETGAEEYDCYYDGIYIGTAATERAAEVKLDAHAYATLSHPQQARVVELVNISNCSLALAVVVVLMGGL